MKNKLLITSALAGVVAFSGLASAELKLGVTQEVTIAGSSIKGGGADSGNGIGSETNIQARGKKELTNGFTASLVFNHELDTPGREMQLIVGNSNFDVIVGNDLTQGLNLSAVPKVGEHPGTISGRGIKTQYQDSFSPENNQDDHIAIQFKNVAGGKIVALYAPSQGSGQNDAYVVGTGQTTGSGTSISYLGKPYPGLTIGLVRDTKQGANTTLAADKKDTEKAYSIAYSMDKFSAGVEKRTLNDGAGVKDIDGMYYGFTAGISDNLSIGLNYAVSENETTTTAPDEKIKMISLGYNFGGLGLELSYADIENASNGTTANADGEVIQLRTVASF